MKKSCTCNGSLNIDIELLYLDLDICEPCQGVDKILEESIEEVRDSLKTLGYEISLTKIHIDSQQKALDYKFLSSPTIRINKQDIQSNYKEEFCDSCSSLVNSSTNCRVWIYQNKEYNVIPKQMIIDAIFSSIYNKKENQIEDLEYNLPENLKTFFENKTVSSSCGCGC